MARWENLLLVNPVTLGNLLQAAKQEKTVDSPVSLVQVLLNDIAGDFSVRESLQFFISSTQQK